jgi:enterochelin esterase-like enzyme
MARARTTAETLEARARKQGSPVIDGDSATFVWLGRKPVSVTGDFQDWTGEPLPLEQLSPGLWTRTLTLPRDAYIEYALLGSSGRRVKDPLNRHRTPNGVGGFNHLFSMPEYSPTELARPVGDRFPRGRVTRHTVQTSEYAVGPSRELFLYQPPVTGPYPLVVVLDGTDYLRRAQLTTLVDNLIRQQHIRPIALAMVANGGASRTLEYSCNDATLAFLLHQVLPLARKKLRLIDEASQPGIHGVLGASLGGLMALYLGLRAPQVFGQVLSQSGAFAIPDHGDMAVFDLARASKGKPLSVWMDCGIFERLTDGNRRMLPVLEKAGHRVLYREYPAGHNYPAWRDDVWRGLEWLYRPRIRRPKGLSL